MVLTSLKTVCLVFTRSRIARGSYTSTSMQNEMFSHLILRGYRVLHLRLVSELGASGLLDGRLMGRLIGRYFPPTIISLQLVLRLLSPWQPYFRGCFTTSFEDRSSPPQTTRRLHGPLVQ